MVPDLPTGEHKFYLGIDPGFTGALGLINSAGTSVEAWDMPVTGTGKKREYDLDGLATLFKRLRRLPQLVVGIEWPTTRPGEGAERSERFGRGKGYLHAYAHVLGLEYYLISPALWKGRLGLPGKSDSQANRIACDYFRGHYPNCDRGVVEGPRGGVRHGRVDALLIAHFLRARTVGGLRSIVDQHGKNSVQAWQAIGRAGRRGRKKTRR